MSDNSQIIVAVDCTAADAETRGREALAWLVAQGVVASEATDSALGGDGTGHPPGAAFATAIIDPIGEEAESFLDLWTNGVQITVGRTVFDTGLEPELHCPGCDQTFEPEEDWVESADAWAEGQDDAEYACPLCGASRSITEWTGPSPWAFGHLGIELWNWPELRPEFLAALSRLLQSNVTVVHSHL